MSGSAPKLLLPVAMLAAPLAASSAFLFFMDARTPPVEQAVLIAHVAAGVLCAPIFAVFLALHVARPPAARFGRAGVFGVLTALAAVAVAISGVAITVAPGSSSEVTLIHSTASLVLVAGFVLHRVFGRAPVRNFARALLAPSALFAAALAADLFPFTRDFPAIGAAEPMQFFPSPMTAEPGSSFVEESRDCARCHPDVAAEWASSAHRFSSMNNPFYKASFEDTRARVGEDAARWCAGCHDPVILASGAPIGRFDPASPEAQAGLTCLSCHGVERLHDGKGNGGYHLARMSRNYWFEGTIAGDYLLRARPEAHKRAMLTDLHRTSDFCGTCHKVSLDVPVNRYRWLRGQNELDAWQDSGIAGNNPATWYEPPKTARCQDCHMQTVPAMRGDLAAKAGVVKSHSFFSANTALPFIRGEAESVARVERYLREGKMSVDLFAVVRGDGRVERPLERAGPLQPGEEIELRVVVRNKGVGHTFPGGTNDSNEGWLEISLFDGDELLARSGALEPGGRVDRRAHFYRAVLVDKLSQRIDRRNAPEIHSTVYANVVPPSASDIARYVYVVPAELTGRVLTVRAALKWRKFDRAFTEFALGVDAPALPITTVAEAAAELCVAPRTCPEKAAPPELWRRMNDYAIGLTLDGDFAGASSAFEEVSRLEANRPDGWLNAGRANLLEGDLAAARVRFDRARALSGSTPRMDYFLGLLAEESGQLAAAEESYLAALARYRNSRGVWSRLGRVRWLAGDHAGAAAAESEVLRIDPEDAQAHQHLALVRAAMALAASDPEERARLEREAEESRAAFDRYRIDERAQAVTQAYRLAHPEDQIMSQKIAVHALVAE
jgi:hypothetical protein